MSVGTVLDLHVHSAQGSSDSSLQVSELVSDARRLGMGVNLSEHNRTWELFKLSALREESGLVMCRGMEVTTDMGHMIVIGLDQYYSGIRNARRLSEVCREREAFLIVAHPFRHMLVPKPGASEAPFTMSPQEAAETMEVFSLVDGIEVGNGGTAPEENAFAYRVAEILGKPMTGGSDAHSTSGFGSFTTVFGEELTEDKDIIEALHDRAATCYTGLHIGAFKPYIPDPA